MNTSLKSIENEVNNQKDAKQVIILFLCQIEQKI